MKKVLITGAGSYIGTSFEKWAGANSPELRTETVDMLGEDWKSKSFQGYDSVFHVAGIAHADVGKVTEEQKALYYAVNTDLALECAKKAKKDGVGQFIYMSSIIVYGASAGVGGEKVITKDTFPAPENFYGASKLKAEEGLRKLADVSFKIVILRPPMIYGKGSKGNYSLLSKMAGKLPLFPDVSNKRSMLYIGNLCCFVAWMIKNEEDGLFFPQNREYVQTSRMVDVIAQVRGHKICITKIFNPALKLAGRFGGRPGELVNKAFGNLVYDKALSIYKEDYQVYSLEESVRLTEGAG